VNAHCKPCHVQPALTHSHRHVRGNVAMVNPRAWVCHPDSEKSPTTRSEWSDWGALVRRSRSSINDGGVSKVWPSCPFGERSVERFV
jgi:hypothetical protein